MIISVLLFFALCFSVVFSIWSFNKPHTYVEQDGMRLDVTLTSSTLSEHESLRMFLTLENQNNYTVDVSGLRLGVSSLKFELISPSGDVWVGPEHIIEMPTPIYTLKPGEKLAYKTSIFIKGSNISMGNMDAEEGTWKISARYVSNTQDGELIKGWDADIKTDPLEFTVRTYNLYYKYALTEVLCCLFIYFAYGYLLETRDPLNKERKPMSKRIITSILVVSMVVSSVLFIPIELVPSYNSTNNKDVSFEILSVHFQEEINITVLPRYMIGLENWTQPPLTNFTWYEARLIETNTAYPYYLEKGTIFNIYVNGDNFTDESHSDIKSGNIVVASCFYSTIFFSDEIYFNAIDIQNVYSSEFIYYLSTSAWLLILVPVVIIVAYVIYRKKKQPTTDEPSLPQEPTYTSPVKATRSEDCETGDGVEPLEE